MCQSQTMTGEWMTAGEGADLLGVSMHEPYRMVGEGEVPSMLAKAGLVVFPWGHRRRLRFVVAPGE